MERIEVEISSLDGQEIMEAFEQNGEIVLLANRGFSVFYLKADETGKIRLYK